MTRLGSGGAALAACTVLALVAATGASAAPTSSREARQAAAVYTVYWLGTAFESQELSGKIKRLEKPLPGETFGADFTSYLYGTCTPDPVDGGCPIPLEIQSWAACKRNLSVYAGGPDGRPLAHVNLKIRGVPAASFDDGTRLEVYTGTTTVVLFSSDGAQLKRAANAMQPAPRSGKPGTPLPPPAPGALTGKLSCS
jgi:hypothetical protein